MDTVDRAFVAVPRAGFLPDARHDPAYDGPIPIGYGQTNSQPRTVREMLTLLEVRKGHKVLDVGSGSGWTTALLAHLVGPTGSVHGVELVPELVEFGRSNLSALDLPWASITQAAPDVLGLPELAPFDRILVSAQAQALPRPLVEQLRVHGRMVIPVNGTMLLVRAGRHEPRVTEHGRYLFVPLR